jgi:hypothetical protein
VGNTVALPDVLGVESALGAHGPCSRPCPGTWGLAGLRGAVSFVFRSCRNVVSSEAGWALGAVG